LFNALLTGCQFNSSLLGNFSTSLTVHNKLSNIRLVSPKKNLTNKLQGIMKYNKIIGTCVVVLGIQLCGYSQTYTLQQTISPIGPGFYDSGNPIGGIDWGSGALSDTVVINPTAYTIEESGSIYLAPMENSLSVTETQSITSVIQDFPNPPMTVTTPVTGNWTITMSLSGGAYSFDTGVQPLSWNGSEYTFNGDTTVQIPISISYSLVTGGQTYSGTGINADLNFPLALNDELDVANYPGSISLNPNSSFYNLPYISGPTVTSFTASDGFRTDLVASVPEPTTWALLGTALLTAKFMKRRQS
jgi:PEP-CTERM motif